MMERRDRPGFENWDEFLSGVQITREMIDAGAAVMARLDGEASRETTAREVFAEMAAKGLGVEAKNIPRKFLSEEFIRAADEHYRDVARVLAVWRE